MKPRILQRVLLLSGALAALAILVPTARSTAQERSAASLPGGHCVMPPPPPGLLPPSEGRRGAAVQRPQLPALDPSLAPSRVLAAGDGRFPAILVDFPTRPAVTSDIAIAGRFFTLGTGSVRDFYRENSYGQFDMDGEAIGWFRSSQTRSYYTNGSWGLDETARGTPYDPNVWGLFHEILPMADAAVDFSQFDRDGDGVVDGLFLVIAGRGAEETGSANDFWSHKFDLRQCLVNPGCYPFGGNGFVTDDGVVIGPYVVVPELGEIGVAAHEFGHVLGLPDLYVIGSGPTTSTSAMGVFAIMDSGAWTRVDSTQAPGSSPSHFCAWSKYTLGWIDPPAVSADAHTPFLQDIVLPPVAAGTAVDPGVLRVLDNPGGADWTRAGTGRGRYFLVENRQNIGFDRGLFGYPPLASRKTAGGLLVTFIDESRVSNTTDFRTSLTMVVQEDGEGFDSQGIPSTGEATDLWPGLPATAGSDTVDVFSAATVTTYGAFDDEVADVLLEGIEVTPGGSARLDAHILSGGLSVKPEAYPNPARGDVPVRIEYLPEGKTPASLVVRIFSLGGSLVRTLERDPGAAETGVAWDLRNSSGSLVASGLYVYVVEADGHTARGSVAVVR